MKLLPAYIRKEAGFTLIEITLVFGLFSIIVLWGLLVSMDFYHQKVISAERDTVVALLERARSEALNNINQAGHGVYVGASNYTIFEGNSYAARDPAFDENFNHSQNITFSGLNEFRFAPLDAFSNTVGIITLSSGAEVFTVSVNSEGRVDW